MAHAYLDPNLSTDARVADLLGRMGVSDKIGQMMQLPVSGEPADVIRDYRVGSILHIDPTRIDDAITIASQAPLGIPLLIADDCIRGYSFWPGATLFPTQLAQACSWNPELIEQAGRVTAVEVSTTGVVWTFSPVLCIARDLRWGRVDETFGEDPCLIGEFGAALLRGYQGAGLTDPTGILACAKHFAGYSETQGGRDASEADISRRKLRSWFLPPFERAAREGCCTFMLGYQSMDGTPITLNSWLLNDVLKGEWGFDGLLVTDWDNVGRMVWEQKICADYAEAATRAVRAGNDLVMSTPGFWDGAHEAIAAGRLKESDLDGAVRRILRVKFELGLFENPRRPDPARQRELIACAAHREVNLALTRQCPVLLRNEGLLPLNAEEPVRIAVVGPNADDVAAQLGDWSAASGQTTWAVEAGWPVEQTTTVLGGLERLAPEGSLVRYAKGAEIVVLGPNPEGATYPDGQPRPPVAVPPPDDPALRNAAAELAADSDVVVVVVGDTVELTGEGCSTATLELFGNQIAILDAVAATGTPLVVVVMSSKPMVLPPSALNADAVLAAFNPGLEGGQAIAEILFGRVEPQGRLPITFARHVGQQPTYYNQIRGQHGSSYADLTQEPAFAFGEGLAFTTFEYADAAVDHAEVALAGTVHASVRVTNTGQRSGTETVQLYASDLVTSVTWAEKELKGFRKVTLQPGESRTVRFELPVSELTLVDADGHRVVEPGDFDLLLGHSSRRSDLIPVRLTVQDTETVRPGGGA